MNGNDVIYNQRCSEVGLCVSQIIRRLMFTVCCLFNPTVNNADVDYAMLETRQRNHYRKKKTIEKTAPHAIEGTHDSVSIYSP